MNRVLWTFLFLCTLSIPAFSDSVSLLVGYTYPKGGSDVFEQNELETTFEVKDLNDFGTTVGYDHFLGDFVNLDASVSYYQSDKDVTDEDFVFSDDSPIRRNISLQIVPLELGVRLLPLGRETSVIPYVGGGVGIYFWKYEESGHFVINRNTDPEVITGVAFSEGTDPGYHIEGGIQIPISRSSTVQAEARYWKAEGDLDEEGFDPLFEPLDLSGTMYSVGFSFWF